MADIFLSYAREDEPRAGQLAAVLEAQGWSVWWDRHIPPGQVFRIYIQRQLDAARCIVVLWSKASVEAQFVHDEAFEGLNDRRLVPVLLEAVRQPLGFRQLHAADLSDWNGRPPHDELDRLVSSVRVIVPSSPAAPVVQPAPASSAPQPTPVDPPNDTAPDVAAKGPAFHPSVWNLPREALLGFVEIPAGLFTMGSDKRTDKRSASSVAETTGQPQTVPVHDPGNIFVSYSRVDLAWVDELVKKLEVAGPKVWLDVHELHAGSAWDSEIEHALQSMNVLMVVLSPDSVKSRNVLDAINFALSKNRLVVPVLYRPCELPYRVARLQHVDFTGNDDVAFPSLVEILKAAVDESRPATQAAADELPQHRVTLPAFFMGRYEVTVGQFKACVNDGGCKPGDLKALDGPDDLPVRYVSWHEALTYCGWLEAKLKSWNGTPNTLNDALAGRRDGKPWHVTLPSEAEWERAARGTDGRIYPWGNSIDPTKANYDEAKRGGPTPVGSFPTGASPEKLLDISGNVWEWTRSHYKPYPYRPDDGRENLKAGDSVPRVVRGGTFYRDRGYVRAAYRGGAAPDGRNDDIGFRLVVSPFSSDL